MSKLERGREKKQRGNEQRGKRAKGENTRGKSKLERGREKKQRGKEEKGDCKIKVFVVCALCTVPHAAPMLCCSILHLYAEDQTLHNS